MQQGEELQGLGAASPWIARFAALVPAGGAVLDLACGGGRHGRLFLERSHPVTFIDIDLGGVADLKAQTGATLLQADLENAPWPLAGRRFAGIVVTNYLWRPHIPLLIEALAPGGLLLWETFLRGHERYGKPSNPDFLLTPNELFERFKDALDILAFEQGEDSQPRPMRRQRIAARRP